MLGDRDAIATVAVKDLEAAKGFYSGKLGLEENSAEEPEVLSYRSGGSSLLVYKSQYAGTNQATAVTWQVDDVPELVRDLKAKGVEFEHYDMPDTRREGDVHLAGDLKLAWFKDPDGNILAVFSNGA